MECRNNTFLNCDILGSLGVSEVEVFFKTLRKVIDIKNVEGDNTYQKIGIDLLLKVSNGTGSLIIPVEVKTIRYSDEYYFIETISNTTKNTLGSFLTCQARYIVFYFINYKKIHIIKTTNFILWFLKNQNYFETKETITQDNLGNVLYTTVGKLVPCKRVISELNPEVFNLN